MLKQKCLKKIISSVFFLMGLVGLYGETFRVSKLHTVEVDSNPDYEKTERMGINDSLAIFLPEEMEFMEGIELKFQIPESVAYWMDSVACSVYIDIKPTPKPSQIDYTGSKLFFRTLPNKLSWVLQMPLKENNSFKSNNYIQKIETVLKPLNGVIFVRLQPVMKGIPEETLNAIIPITVKPVLSNIGKLDLSLLPPKDELKQCSVFIDDEMISFPSTEPIYLPVGVHDISIISESYRNELRTVRIEQAQITELSIDMKSIEPTLLITAPEGTTIMLDETECNIIGEEFEITEGEHEIRFSIGNYEMVRKINAIKGKTYKAIFSLDLQITEE